MFSAGGTVAIAFTVGVGASDWNQELSGWRCPALRIPGAEVDAVYTQDGRADKAWYEVPAGLEIIRWVHGTRPPDNATLSLRLTKELSTQELTARWKQLAIVLPFVASIVVAAISAYVPKPKPPSPPSPSPSVNVWTLKGAVKDLRQFDPHQVETYVMPPDLRLKDDFTFEGQLPIETKSDGSLALPNVVLFLKKSGFKTAVVHLVNTGEKPAPGAIDDYNQSIDPLRRIIEIRKPIEFLRTDIDPPFAPTQSAVPVVPVAENR